MTVCHMLSLVVASCLPFTPVQDQVRTGRPIRVLVITGGHDFDRPGFDALWASLPNISRVEVSHPEAHVMFRPERASEYDAIVCYDMHQNIDQEARENLVRLLKRGKGLIVWHHAMANYQDWPEWLRISGGRFRLHETAANGARRPASTWKHDVRFRVKVANPRHPVTRGLTDFELTDEVYGDFDVLPGVTPLLRTDEPASGPVIAWAHTYGRARVITIQPGHGPGAWSHPSFRRLMSQAALWVARR